MDAVAAVGNERTVMGVLHRMFVVAVDFSIS